jgi:hypothetical protein
MHFQYLVRYHVKKMIWTRKQGSGATWPRKVIVVDGMPWMWALKEIDVRKCLIRSLSDFFEGSEVLSGNQSSPISFLVFTLITDLVHQ